MARKNSLLMLLSGLALFVLLLSCMSPLNSKGGAGSISLQLGGVLPPALASNSSARRAFVPGASAGVRVKVSGKNTNIDKTYTLASTPNDINIGALPVNVALSVEVTTFDGENTLIGSWSGTVTLVEGTNPIPVVLAPPAASVIPLIIPTTNSELSLEIATLAPAKVRFYDLVFQGASREWHIIANTSSGRFLYMEAYDEEWKKLDTLITQSSQGWTVLAAGGGEHIRIAVANTLQSPGYPLAAASFTLQARQALFASPTASPSGTGTSTDPGLIQNSIEIPGISLFLKEGDYTIPGSSGLNIREDVQTYGSFSNASWKVRNTQTMRSWFVKETEGNGPTMPPLEIPQYNLSTLRFIS